MHTVQVEEGVWTVYLKSVSHKNCAENFNVIQQTDLNMSFAEYLSGVNFFDELRLGGFCEYDGGDDSHICYKMLSKWTNMR